MANCFEKIGGTGRTDGRTDEAQYSMRSCREGRIIRFIHSFIYFCCNKPNHTVVSVMSDHNSTPHRPQAS